MTTTYTIECPCTLIWQYAEACGETVTLTFEGGFEATTATVEACAARKAEGITSYEVRKSVALGFTVAPATT